MISRIRKSIYTRIAAGGLIPLIMSPGLVFGVAPVAPAPSGGSADPNLVSAGAGEMVNLASGDFSYSIPLLEVGGHPITLSYNANIGMDDPVSVVGLGWNINTGAMNRTVRGIPDDFDGDKIKTTMNLRPNLTVAHKLGVNLELVGQEINGLSDIGLEAGVTFNNYTGNETTMGLDVGLSYGSIKDDGYNLGFGMGIHSSSRSGLSTNVGATLALGSKVAVNAGLGLNQNTLHGSSLNPSFGVSKTFNKKVYVPGVGGRAGHYKKERWGRGGLSLGGSFPLSSQSYTPTANFNFKNLSLTGNIDAGVEFLTIYPHLKYTFSYYQNCLDENEKEQRAYGYMNLEKGYDKNAIQDFNLNLPKVHEEVNGLDTPIPTYDYFTSSSSGDMFRAIRNDVGYVKNPSTKSEGDAAAISGEIGWLPPVNVQGGLNLSYSWNNASAGEWNEENPFSEDEIFKYKTNGQGSTNEIAAKYEKYTFQKINNRSTITDAQYATLKGNNAIRQEIHKNSGEIKGDGYMVADDGTANYDVTNNQHFQYDRRDRNVVFQQRSNKELRDGLDAQFTHYTINDHSYSNGYVAQYNNRSASAYPNNHIGEITVLSSGGSREVYGIPVMNSSEQVSFNMSTYNNYNPNGVMDLSRDIDNMGLVEYTPNTDNSLNNKRGNNFYYLKNEVPTHATSYLLTEQLSGNYTDVTGNGPTPDDIGDYVRYNYSHLGVSKWRFPYQQNRATFNEGFKSDELDDMGSYQYGTRDAYLIHSIETKDYIAEFVYDDRNDGYDVLGENGGISSVNHSRSLKQIKLFTRKGKELGNGPIKSVNFVYNHSLCVDTPDNALAGTSAPASERGKLTLLEVYFENYDSPLGKMHRYRFDYGNVSDPVNNPSYDLGHVDRWGCFKDDNTTIDHAPLSILDNNEYPYAEQNKTTADAEIQAWKLKAIDLPSGSRIEVEYEADDYEYIQDKEATRMYKVLGYYSWDQISGYVPVPSDFGDVLYADYFDNKYAMLVDLDHQISGSYQEVQQIMVDEFMPAGQHLYFNTLLNLAPYRNNIEDPDLYEAVQGYCNVEEIRPVETTPGSGIYNRAIVNISPDKIDSGDLISKKVHPISRKAWQVMKEMLPLAIYPENDLKTIYSKDNMIICDGYDEYDASNDQPELTDDSKNHQKNMLSIPNIYQMMLMTGYAARAVPGKSWIRLKNGPNSKIGGGHRVKSIKVYDNWDEFVTGENLSVYGSQYEYITTNSRGGVISSGVASYEPLNGGDEIALRTPKYYYHDGKGVPNERYYTEFPLNEEIFASTDIKYSEVKVSSIEYAGLTLNTPGYTVFKHYTAKDYPVQFDQTNAKSELRKPGIVGAIGYSKRRFGFSYGTSTIVNDMHGKFKGKYVYSTPTNTPDGMLIYKEEHFYRENTNGTLRSMVPVVHKDGSITEQLLGLNFDVMTHLNFAESNHSNINIGGNLEYDYPPPPIGALIPSISGSAMTSENSIFSTLTTKIIYQSGILEKVVVEDNGRYKTTANVLFDAKTGAPIVTEISPEVPDENGNGAQKIYEYNYPAHWAHSGMEIASENVNIARWNILDANGNILTSEKQYFHPGDVLITSITNQDLKLTVVENELTGNYFLAKDNGDQYLQSGSVLYKVFLPGRKNFTGAPMATVSTLDTYPTGTSPYAVGYNHTNIINVAGADFTDLAKVQGACFSPESSINPYRYNMLGQWKQHKTYAFDHERDYSTGAARKDGLLTVYQPFWKNEGGGQWLPIYDPARSDYNSGDPLQNWFETAESVLHDHYGYNLEQEDALDLKLANYIGYNRRHPEASVSNSRYVESGFDGFEDYYSEGTFITGEGDPLYRPFGCSNQHFRIEEIQPTEEEAHTGRYSVRVEQGTSVSYESTTWDGVEPVVADHEAPFLLAESDIIHKHQFVNGEAENVYVVMGWIKEHNNTQELLDYTAQIQITVNGGLIPVTEKRSNIIDGWQRVELTFEVDDQLTNDTPMEIRLVAGSAGAAFFDDIRVHPFDSEMEAQVIDAIEQRPAAQLDNRNFATIFQYDEDGNMIRTIKETERGKQTVQENRSGIKIYE